MHELATALLSLLAVMYKYAPVHSDVLCLLTKKGKVGRDEYFLSNPASDSIGVWRNSFAFQEMVMVTVVVY